jgi:hypothetical protein
MNTTRSRFSFVSMVRVGLIVAVLFGVSGLLAQAGSVADTGTLPGLPAVGTINYLAWYSTATPPTQVLTEDSYNSSTGTDKGYISISGTPTWRVKVGEGGFLPPPGNGATVYMLFGGMGTQVTKIWTSSFAWDSSVPTTAHTEVAVQGSGTCPTMGPGSRTDTGKVITWSTNSAAGYAIYRSQTPSGAVNAASNGRYDLVTTVSGATTSYTDNACTTNVDCWHLIVPLNGSNQISSCHSQESSPTAVALTALEAKQSAPNWPLYVGLGVLALLALGGLLVYRRRVAAR